jgi:ribosomal protein L15E
MVDNITSISEFPDDLKKYLDCWLLHNKYPVIDKDLKIRYVCKECNHDNDPSKVKIELDK